MSKLRVALAQINTLVADFDGNGKKIIDHTKKAAQKGADIIAFPELALCGYPPEDLLFQSWFLEKAKATINSIANQTKNTNIIIIIGYPEWSEDVYNSAAIIYKGKIVDNYRKLFLPNYAEFDEKRYFTPGKRITVYKTNDFRFGVGICEDIWHPDGPIGPQVLVGNADIIININASPYFRGKNEIRRKMVSTRSFDNAVAVCYLNCIGGQDELVFDGQSFATDAFGKIIASAQAFEEELLFIDFDLSDLYKQRLLVPRIRDRKFVQTQKLPNVETVEVDFSLNEKSDAIQNKVAPLLREEEEVWFALVTGLRDYTLKNGFKSVVLGLSGGIDSAVVATIAADALGSENVYALFMPSQFTSSQSYEDAKKLAENLGINFKVVEIEPLFKKYLEYLEPHFEGKPFDITEENIQARIRANILMAFSNKFDHLVLATGNKSELSVGYATLYGDMVGGFAVIKDVPKTLVWKLARWRNEKEGKELIPESIITKPPSAELKENQLDTDTLPPYETLDRIIELYIEKEHSEDEIVEKTGLPREFVRRVIRMIDSAEYKRRQAAPGIKITQRAFGKERRMPITRKK